MWYILLKLSVFLGIVVSFCGTLYVIASNNARWWQFASPAVPLLLVLAAFLRVNKISWANVRYCLAIIAANVLFLCGHYGLLSHRSDYHVYPGFLCVLLGMLILAIGASMPSTPYMEGNSRVNVFGKSRALMQVPDALWRATRVPVHFINRGMPLILLGILVTMVLVISNPESPRRSWRNIDLHRWEVGAFVTTCCLLSAILLWRTCARIGYLAPAITASKLLRASRLQRTKKNIDAITLAPFAFTNEYYESTQKRNHFRKLFEESMEIISTGQDELVALDGFDNDTEEAVDSTTYKPKIPLFGWLLLCPCYRNRRMENHFFFKPIGSATGRSTYNAYMSNTTQDPTVSGGMRHRVHRLDPIDESDRDDTESRAFKRIRKGKTLLKAENRINQWFALIGSLLLGTMLLCMLQYHLFVYWRTLHTVNFLSTRRFWTICYTAFMYLGQMFFVCSIPTATTVPRGLDDSAIAPTLYSGNPKNILILLPPDRRFDGQEIAGLYYTFIRRGHVVTFFSAEGKREKRRLRRAVEAAPSSLFGISFAQFHENVQSAGLLPSGRTFEEYVLSLSEWDATTLRKESLMRVAGELLGPNDRNTKCPVWFTESFSPSPWELRPFGGGMYPDLAAMYAEMVSSKEWGHVTSWSRRLKQIRRNQTKIRNTYLHSSKSSKSQYREQDGNYNQKQEQNITLSASSNSRLDHASPRTNDSSQSTSYPIASVLPDSRRSSSFYTQNDEKQRTASNSSQYSESTNTSYPSSGSGDITGNHVSLTSFAYGFDAVVVPTIFDEYDSAVSLKRTRGRKKRCNDNSTHTVSQISRKHKYSSIPANKDITNTSNNNDYHQYLSKHRTGWFSYDTTVLHIVSDFVDAQKPVLTFGNGICVLRHALNTSTSPDGGESLFPDSHSFSTKQQEGSGADSTYSGSSYNVHSPGYLESSGFPEIPAPPSSVFQLLGCSWLRKRNRVHSAWKAEALRIIESYTASFVWPIHQEPVSIFKMWVIWLFKGEWLLNGCRRALQPRTWLQKIQETVPSQLTDKPYLLYDDVYTTKTEPLNTLRLQDRSGGNTAFSDDPIFAGTSMDSPQILEGLGFIAALCAGDVFVAAHLLMGKIENASLVF